MTKDKDLCDLLIVMGSSLQVGPVNEIPDAISPNVPAILSMFNHETDCMHRKWHASNTGPTHLLNVVLVNRESLHSGSEFDGELLGNCDEIVKYLTHKLRWKDFDGNADLAEVTMEHLVKEAEQRLEQLKTQQPNQQQQDKLCDDKQNEQQQSAGQPKENETTTETESTEPTTKRPKIEGEHLKSPSILICYLRYF